MGHTALAFADPGEGKASVLASRLEMTPRSRALGVSTAGEIRVGVQARVDVTESIADPAHHAVRFGTVDVADKAVEALVALWCPRGDEASEMAHRSGKVEAGHTRGVKDLHEDLSRNGL